MPAVPTLEEGYDLFCCAHETSKNNPVKFQNKMTLARGIRAAVWIVVVVGLGKKPYGLNGPNVNYST